MCNFKTKTHFLHYKEKNSSCHSPRQKKKPCIPTTKSTNEGRKGVCLKPILYHLTRDFSFGPAIYLCEDGRTTRLGVANVGHPPWGVYPIITTPSVSFLGFHFKIIRRTVDLNIMETIKVGGIKGAPIFAQINLGCLCLGLSIKVQVSSKFSFTARIFNVSSYHIVDGELAGVS